ncbi:Disease resistance protein L6 [Linum perenne]
MDSLSPSFATPLNRSESFFNYSSSSSTNPALPAGEYEVFLSFRGPDVRTSFADCLYSCLVRSRIRTFRDEEELRKGEQIAPSLVQAIIESKIHIPIFSQDYASSKWCLQELAKMVECWKQGKGHVILPIFYFMNPRDVRHQDGPYKQAFELHAQKHDADTVKEWREALQEVGKMKGWTVKDSDGQGAVIDEVFSRVDSHLMMNYKLVSDQDCIGIDFHVDEVMKLLDSDSQSVKVVSIHGIGGIGKTTIAKAVYDRVFTQFDRCCFLEDVRDTLTRNDGVLALQKKVISVILKHDARVEDNSQGIQVIKDRICKHKVLIVLDDIDDTFEFDKILGEIGDFSPGSRFLFTTRDRILNFHTEYKSYELREMSHDYSLQLFSKHAFGMDYPPTDYISLSHKFVEAAAGLPLALKVIGSLLFRKDQKVWEEKLMQLKEVPPSMVQKRLKISYDALNYEEQQIFLDIACFFIGENKMLPIYMWSDCKFHPEGGISTLIIRSLIKVNESDKFWMHDHIRDLGRAIVRDENVEHPSKRSRIWSRDDALDMLKSKQGTVDVRALKVDHNCELTEEEFRNLPKLRYLEVKSAGLTGDFTEILPDIRWLRLCSCPSIPSRFEMKKLVTLELKNLHMRDGWAGWREIKMAKKLKVITLSRCYGLKRTPDLSECGSLELLTFEHSSMKGELKIGNWKCLRKLLIVDCEVTKLADNIRMLTNLEVINYFGCYRANLLLPKLTTSIKTLVISSTVPNLSELKDLQELRFEDCRGGLRIPGDIWKLSNLKTLIIKRALRDTLLVTEARNGIMCSAPLVLPSSLICLCVDDFEDMQRLPNLANLNNLKELSLTNIGGVTEIHGLGEVKLLVTLRLYGAANLKYLEGLENLVLLTDLRVENCPAIKRMPNFATLNRLCCLVISNCQLLTKLKGIGELVQSLSHLEIRSCPNLSDVEGLQSLSALELLQLEGCDLVERLPSLSKLERLKTLILKENPRLSEIESLDHLKSLLRLEISQCNSLERLPDLSYLQNLNTVCIDHCQGLTELTVAEGLELLVFLGIEFCESVTKLSILSTRLKRLKIDRCEQLSEFIGIEGLESLELLELRNCPSIQKLPGCNGSKMIETRNWNQQLKMDSLSPNFATPLNRSESFFNYSSSSSSGSALPTGEYEVFLSFRGPDVRTSFADCLYSCLIRSKIRTFRDEEELRKGEQIAPSLVQAIIESKIHIPIFSQDYASSKWCLQELAKMVECWKQGKGHIILPIFYFVNPRDVRHQDGPYKQAFELHAQKHDADTVKEWREALQEVGKMKGWTVKDSDGQGAIIDEVFSRVDSILMRNYKLVADEDLVGVDFHVEQVVQLLDLDSQSVAVVSIHGIGGSGKTTISKAVYDKVCSQFDRCCFLEDVRETLKKNEGVVNLQNKVLSVILKHDYQVENASNGIHLIKDRVCKHKVLLVLDDIDDMFEFEKILGNMDAFASGSRFVITTRDQILNFRQDCKSYELGEMSHDHSLQLFYKHAFRMDYPPEDYAILSSKFVEAAAGLPLALKVMGSLLFRKDMKIWEENLIRFKEIPPCKVQERLKISYDALTYEEQQIFLDIACLFIGEDKRLPLYMWDGCNFFPESAINTLVLRSLIKINGSSRFWMHDHIRDLGRAIVRDEGVENPGKRSRIWSENDALDMLKNNQGTDHVRALKFQGQECSQFTKKEFKNLSGLRYLEVIDASLTGDFTKTVPDLRWLVLSSCASIPASFGIEKLVILDLSGVWVGDGWSGWRALKMARKLKVVYIENCNGLKRAPDLSACGSLEVLKLHYCDKMSGELHVGNFKCLKELIIRGCGITISSTVPNLSDLKDLEVLLFQQCNGVIRIPGDLWKLSKLKTLKVTDSSCDSSELLVEDASMPSSLNCLHFERCGTLPRLPSVANLNNLSELRLTKVGVREIHGLGELRNLVSLHVAYAQNLDNLDGLETLVLLEDLMLIDCPVMGRLPSLAALNKLTRLEIRECWIFTKIQGLHELGDCLSDLVLIGCLGLTHIEGLQSLVALENLTVTGCDSLKRLPTLSSLVRLKTVILWTDNTPLLLLHEPESFNSLNLLQELNLSGLNSMKHLPDLSHLKSLKSLTISRCDQLKKLKGLHGLELLGDLSVENCQSIMELNNLSGLKNLNKLRISECSQLTEITGFEGLESLVGLFLYACTSIEKLSDLSGLKKLEELSIHTCTQLSEVKGLEGLESLVELWIDNCPSLERLADLSGLRNLLVFETKRCPQLTVGFTRPYRSPYVITDENPGEGFGNRAKLKGLLKSSARYCKKLTNLAVIQIPDDLWKLSKLKTLTLTDCSCDCDDPLLTTVFSIFNLVLALASAIHFSS